jgi:hypothetical protein
LSNNTVTSTTFTRNTTNTSNINPETGDGVASSVIGVLFLVWIAYGLLQAHLGREYGTFFDRFLQNTLSCCSVDLPEDVENAAEFTGMDMSDAKSLRYERRGVDAIAQDVKG